MCFDKCFGNGTEFYAGLPLVALQGYVRAGFIECNYLGRVRIDVRVCSYRLRDVRFVFGCRCSRSDLGRELHLVRYVCVCSYSLTDVRFVCVCICPRSDFGRELHLARVVCVCKCSSNAFCISW